MIPGATNSTDKSSGQIFTCPTGANISEPWVCSSADNREAPCARQIPINLAAERHPKFLRVRIFRDSEQTENGVLLWDGVPFGSVNASLPETHQTDFDFPVSPGMSFKPGHHLLGIEVTGASKPVRWLKVLSLHIPADDEEPTLTRDPGAVELFTITSHCDFAWRHTRAWHERRYIKIIRQVLALLRRYPHYIFQIETKNEMLVPFMKWACRYAPRLIDELKEHLDSGRIEVVCALSNPRLSEVYPETIVRNMVLGRQYFLSLAPRYSQEVYNAVDVMPGCSQMPQICKLAGYSYFMFTRPMGRQVVFLWQGLDGTLLLSSRSGYSIGHDLSGITPACARLRRVPVERVMIGHDDSIPEERLAREASTWDPAKKRICTITAYFKAVEQYKDRIDTVGPILDSLCTFSTAGLQGTHNLYLRNNQLEDLLLCAESLQLLTSMVGEGYNPREMEPFWQRFLENTGHAMCHLFAEDFRRRSNAITRNRKRLAAFIARKLDQLGAAATPGKIRGRPVIVANRLGWPRSGTVSLPVPNGNYVVLDQAGTPLPTEFDGKKTLTFLTTSVPSTGYTTFYLRKTRACQPMPQLVANRSRIENEFLSVGCALNGKLTIQDKLAGYTLGQGPHGGMGDVVFRPASPPQEGWMLLGPFGKAEACAWESGSIRSMSSPVRQVLVATGRIRNSVITRTICLLQGSRRIDFSVLIDSRDRQDGVFRFSMPFDHSGELTAGIPFGAEQRSGFDRELFREEFFVRGYPNGYHACRWTDYSCPEYGVTFVCPHGAFTGYEFDPAAKIFEFTLLRTRSTNETAGGAGPDAMYGQGLHEFTAALVPHPGTWRKAHTFRDALELHNPLVARMATARSRPSANRAHAEQAFLSVNAPNVVLSSARVVNENECEVRLYEACGQAADVTMELIKIPVAATAVNFMGQPLVTPKPIAIDGTLLHFSIAPWEIMTCRLRF